jgi:hypothetical protein
VKSDTQQIRRYSGLGEPHVLLVCPDGSEDRMAGSNNVGAMRAARNQSLFRSLNEKVNEINEGFQVVLEDADYVCECAKDDCLERVRLTADEYTAIRRVPTHFFVKRDHVFPEVERIVDERDGFVVVEKFGEAGAEAVALARETLQSQPS